jgi:hypothetical protein
MSKHLYKVIVKVQLNTGTWVFRKFNTSMLITFIRWVESKYKAWLYVNIYDLRTGNLYGSYTVKGGIIVNREKVGIWQKNRRYEKWRLQ